MNRLLDFYLSHLFKRGRLAVTYAGGSTRHYGDGNDDGVPLRVRFEDSRSEWALALNPALKLGETYMNGGFRLEQGTIFDLLRLVMVNAGRAGAGEPWMRAIERGRLAMRRFAQNNTPTRARKNVRHHYDLSNALYSLFLDKDWQYSCAYFEHDGQSLDDAQLAKKRHIAAKLLFDRPDLKTLDIGSGWGGLGLYLADICGAQVTGVTLSVEQKAMADERAAAAGLEGKVRFALEDYRTTKGPFDRIVSVGMFEHVGPRFYDEFFRQCAKLLHDDGVMLLHTIGRFQPPENTNSWMAKYIFPGGYMPALSEVMPALQRSGLIVADVEVLRLHYGETLRHWRERFAERREEAKALYDERFCRMWEFYLAASETSFRWQDLVVFQFQLVKRHGVAPTTRGYIGQAEDELRKRESGTSPATLPASDRAKTFQVVP